MARNNNRKPRNFPKDKKEEKVTEEVETKKFGRRKKGTNDPEWYAQSPELLRDAASIPFSWPVGTPMRSNTAKALDTVPGLCVLRVTPTVGTSLNVNSPVNVAASAIYSWVRHANSGHANYDAPDLMMYLLAMSNIYSNITWMQRLYAYASVYDQRNRYLPRAVLWADDVDFGSIRDNLANFRYFLNAHINKVASLAIPDNMPVFRRLAFLYSNVYVEGPSIKDQLYMYAPRGNAWYKFGINSDTGAGELSLYEMPKAGSKATYEEVIAYATDLFNAIWDQEDFGIMSGDILKAYDGRILKLSPVPEQSVIAPIYDAMVLHQMKNAKFGTFLTIGKISQSGGTIAQSLIMNASATDQNKNAQFNLATSDKILSTDFDNPGPEVVIESTRLMLAYDAYSGTFTCGTEVLTNVRFVYFTNSGDISEHIEGSNTHPIIHSVGATGDYIDTMLLCSQIISNFKYAPEVYRFDFNDNNTVKNMFTEWDIDNYAVLSNQDLIKMHESALLSLFAVPSIAKIS